VFEKIYVGPETQIIGSDGYRQLLVGVHFTTIKTERHEWSAAAGFARDTEHRSAPYLRVGVMTRL
jgi:cellulose biosynthesis protein BcsS